MPVEQRVVEIIAETIGIAKNQIKMEDNLIDLVDDSIQLFELLIRFEKELGQKVKYDEIVNIEKVADIVKYAYLKGFVIVNA